MFTGRSPEMLARISNRIFGYIRAALYIRRRFPHARVHPTARIVGAERMMLAEAAHVGRHTSLQIPHNASLFLGEGAWVGDDCDIAAGGTIVIGARTSIQHRSQLLGDVRIGAGCACAANLYVSSGRHAFDRVPALPIRLQDHLASQTPWAERSQAVVIGDDCWIGINVVVLPGITIGRGCVIGANSVVSKDLPPYSVAAGVPTRLLRMRLDFAPPASLDASNDFHLPYFYAGFRQLSTWASEDTAVPRQSGGLRASEQFTVALQIADGEPFSLQLDASTSGRIRHGDVMQTLRSGRQTIHFNARPGRWKTLAFEWFSDQSSQSSALIVMSVCVEQEPHLVGAAP